MKGWSRWVSILAAIAAAGSGITLMVTDWNPKAGAVVAIASTFIAIFCERVTGGASKYEIVPEEEEV